MKEFHSFAQAAEHFLGLAAEMLVAEHEGLELAARLIEKEAKREIGEYQNGAGPFVGWAELADSTKTDRVSQGFTENDPGLRTGEMRDSIEHVVQGNEAHVGSDDQNLVWFELGTSKQPPRSVLGLAAVSKGQEAADLVGGMVSIALVGEGVHKGRMVIRED